VFILASEEKSPLDYIQKPVLSPHPLRPGVQEAFLVRRNYMNFEVPDAPEQPCPKQLVLVADMLGHPP
jgi:hypothetical protein